MVVQAVLGEPRLRQEQQVTCRVLQRGGPSRTATTFPPTVPPLNLPEISAALHANYPARHPVLDESRPPRRTGWTCASAAAGMSEAPWNTCALLQEDFSPPSPHQRTSPLRRQERPLLELHDPAPAPLQRRLRRARRTCRGGRAAVGAVPWALRRRCRAVGVSPRRPGQPTRLTTRAPTPLRLAAGWALPAAGPSRGVRVVVVGLLAVSVRVGRPAGSTSPGRCAPFARARRTSALARLRTHVVGGGHLGAASCWAVRRRRSLWWSTAWVTRAMSRGSSTR